MTNIFREPAEPFTLFSYSDFLILISFNFVLYFLHKKRGFELNKVITGVLLLIIIPLISAKIELAHVHDKFEIVDGFNILYVYLKFPVWWLIGILNLYLINTYYRGKKWSKTL